ncbi:MAG: beta strand repeat-containing protein [Flavobacteriales bacterium]
MIIKLFLSKIRIYCLFLLLIFLVQNIIAQVGIGTTKIHDSAILEIESNAKGFLPPRMSQQKMMEILNPVEGLMVFNSTVNCLFFHNGSIWVNTCTLGSAVQASITSLVCSGSGGNVTEYQGGVINDTDVLTASSGKLINVSYTGGNGQSYPIESIASTGVTGLTAEVASGVLEGSTSALADGSVSFIITGTPSGHGVATFAVEFLGQNNCGNIDVTINQAPVPEIDNLLCSGSNNTKYLGGELVQGEPIPSNAKIRIKYSNGNGIDYPAFTLTSTGDATLTASFPAGTLATGNGFIVSETITGTVSNVGVATFDVSFLGHNECSDKTINLISSDATIDNLICTGSNKTEYQNQGSDVVAGVEVLQTENKRIRVRYANGNGQDYDGVSIASTGITGLTATLQAGTLGNNNGNVFFIITGTASGAGTATFPLEFLGHSDCGDIDVTVASPPASIDNLVCTGSNKTEYQNQGSDVVAGVEVLSAANKRIKVRYANGNGQDYDAVSIASTGITGLTATLQAGTLGNSNGTVFFIITGTASSAGTATFPLEFLGHNECGDIDVTVASPPASIDNLICTGSSKTEYQNQGSDVVAGVEVLSAENKRIRVRYSNGNGQDYAGVSIASTGITGLTATLQPGTLGNNNGNVFFIITGTASSAGTATFPLEFLGHSDCGDIDVTVASPPATIDNLVCTGSNKTEYQNQGSEIMAGVEVLSSENKRIKVRYANGNGQDYDGVSIASTGITGLTATLQAGTLGNSNGNVFFIISGTASSAGTATFPLEFLGHNECGDIDVLVESSTPATTPTQYIKANSIVNGRQFGQHLQVSADNSFMVVGTESEVAGSSLGALYTYTRNNSTDTWQFSNKINPPSGSTGHFGFGHNFTLTGNGQRLIASTPSGTSSSYSGEVFVYNRSGNSFVLNQTITHPNSSLSSTDVGFGRNVKVSESGNVLVIAASHENVGGVTDAGRIYIYEYSGGTYTLKDSFNKTHSSNSENFGASTNFKTLIDISNDDNTIAIGHSNDNSGSQTDQSNTSSSGSGAVFVYKKSGGNWSETQYVKASNIDSDDRFGCAVGLNNDGTILLVGAFYERGDGPIPNNNGSDNGAVYEYQLVGNSYVFQNYIKAPNTDSFDEFGRQLILNNAGDIMCVTAPEEAGDGTDLADNSLSSSGASYIYKKSGGTWTMTKYIKPEVVDAVDLGRVEAMSEDGTKIYIGSRNEGSNDASNPNNNSAPGSGAVHYFNLD